MLTLIPAAKRGRSSTSWLDSRHTFSFGEYHDPKRMGFRALRVVNDDRVAPGGGFPTHGHADMEIVSYVLEGALEHKDSLGTGSVIRPGDVQRMSAGTGVRHSEFNASKTEGVHFLQIWIIPDRRGHAPGYEQKAFPESERRGKLRLVASPDGREGSVSLHQDVTLHIGVLAEGEKASLAIAKGRYAFVHVASGAAVVNGQTLSEGDGAALDDEASVAIDGRGGEVLVFDLG
ncbi:MAG TPA: pirin family protein [Polyangia bacterium]|nr:pirin family protein [Polyangia bacterium]